MSNSVCVCVCPGGGGLALSRLVLCIFHSVCVCVPARLPARLCVVFPVYFPKHDAEFKLNDTDRIITRVYRPTYPDLAERRSMDG